MESNVVKSPPGPGVELTTKELNDLGCGRELGRYTLLRRIATGGMAEVYVARSRGISGFEKKVAIKKILPQHSHNERFIDMLVDEAKITVSLTHPNIAQVYELGLDGEESYFIVMEYVEGRPLNRLMQRVDERNLMTIPIEHAVHVMSEVAKGLDHAHKQKDQRGSPLSIVHRDISPQNVLIAYQGEVKLIDFGIARAEGRIAQTSAGVIKGKLRYLAPEIAAGDEPDHRADIYCCGIVLFEMLTGEAMFAPKSDLEAIEMASQARVRSPRSRNPKVPPDLDDIVMMALRRDRNDRFQQAKHLHEALRRFLNQHYPAFVGNELGDFMQQLFAAEIQQERSLDAYAEQVAERRKVEPFADDPTVAGQAGELLRSGGLREGRRQYKPIVTRVGIGIEEPRAEVRLIGADGGEPMGIVLASEVNRPAFQPAGPMRFPATLQPVSPHNLLKAGPPTERAPVPHVEIPSSIVPTVKGPPPEPTAVAGEIKAWEVNPSSTAPTPEDLDDDGGGDVQAKGEADARPSKSELDSKNPFVKDPSNTRHDETSDRVRARTASFRLNEQLEPEPPLPAQPPASPPDRAAQQLIPTVSSAPKTEVARPSFDRDSQRPRPRGPVWGYVFAFVAVTAGGGSLIFLGLAPSESNPQKPIVIPSRNSNIPEPMTIQPVRVEVAGDADVRFERAPGPPISSAANLLGTITLRLHPDVPATVEVDGAVRVENRRSPILLDRLAANRPHRLRVSANGYAPQETSELVRAGADLALELTLQPGTGTIVVRGALPGSISTDLGRVEGQSIVGVPLDSEVSVHVIRTGGKEWTEDVRVTSTEPIDLVVPQTPVPSTAPSPAPSPARLPKGSLVVSSRPVSTVYINGKKKGLTPVKLRLSAGKYKITLVGPDGERKTTTKAIAPQKTTTIVHRWPR